MPSQVRAAGCIVVGLALLAGHAAADPVARRIVALSGTDGPLGPGLGAGTIFGSLDFAFPMIDEFGGVAFPALIAGPAFGGRAIFHERNGTLALIVRDGDPAPQFHPNGAIRWVSAGHWSLSPDGYLSFEARVRIIGGSSILDRQSLWAETPGGLFIAALEEEPAPGAPDGYEFWSIYGAIASSTDGGIAFEATLRKEGQPFIDGIWKYHSGELRAVAVTNMPAHEPGMTFRAFQSSSPYALLCMTPAGQISFPAYVNREGLPPTAFGYVTQNHVPAPVMEEGVHPPGVPDNLVAFDLRSPPVLASSGRFAIHARLSESGLPDSKDSGIWSDRGGDLQPLVLTGSPMPGIEPPTLFTIIGEIAINDHHDVAFWGYNMDSGVTGYWIAAADGLTHLMVRSNSQAPGNPVGVSLNLTHGPFLNNAGHAAFMAEPVAPNNRGEPNWGYSDSGVYVANSAGKSVMLFRTGQPIEISHGDVRWIDNIALHVGGLSASSGLPQAFNDRSELACRLYFTDGTYAVVVGQPHSFCSADTNGDGAVNFADINEVLGAFNNAVLEPHYDFDADLDFDGKVDFADLNLVISQLGDDCGG